MSYNSFSAIRIEVENRISVLTIDHAPINLLDSVLISELNSAAKTLAADEEVRVVVVQSADPEFFIAHADVNDVQEIAGRSLDEDPASSPVHEMTERFRTMAKPTIAKIRGVARGGGLEMLAGVDMRFCSIERTTLAQPELTLGVIPGGGGASRWPSLIGYARAMELMIGCFDFDGAAAEKYGLVNRALPDSELDDFVDELARRIASFTPAAVAMIKNIGQLESPIEERLAVEHRSFLEIARHPKAMKVMKAFMDAGGQTREFELQSSLK
ncbi:MAG: enoyl-CoA hydratase/isomerase family protein [Pseudomonadota bacterium]